MPRQRSPDSIKAEQMYIDSGGKLELVDIAKELNISDGTVRSWKNRYKWDSKLNATLQKKNVKTKRNVANKKCTRGAPKGNKNAKGHGAPAKNKNAETHGFFSKYLPEDTFDIIQEINKKDPLDILWENINIQYAAIIRSQRIMNVTEKEEMIKELKRSKVKSKDRSIQKTSTNESEQEYEYEFQFAWDRQATFLQAQSRAMSELRSLIKQYDEMLHTNWNLATEEQKLRINKLKVDIEKATGDGNKDNDLAKAVLQAMDKRKNGGSNE